MRSVAVTDHRGESAKETMPPLTLDELKNLCLVVTAGMGLNVEAVQHYGRHTDLFLGCKVLLRPRRILMRLMLEQADAVAVSETAMEAHRRGCADHLLLTMRALPEVTRSTLST